MVLHTAGSHYGRHHTSAKDGHSTAASNLLWLSAFCHRKVFYTSPCPEIRLYPIPSVYLYYIALGATTISFILSHRMIIDSYPTYYHQLHFTQFQVQNLCRMQCDLENFVSKHALVFNPKPTIEIQNTKSQN